MEKVINERLNYYLENRIELKCYQSGFRKVRSTIDPALCLEHETRRAHVNKESVVAVFFDVEIACDMMWDVGRMDYLLNYITWE